MVTLDKAFTTASDYGKPGLYALISFADSGTGMDEKTKMRIFEPFFTTKEVGKGTGLGLAVVYGIVKQHDGYISLQSEPGSGTEFKIYLPVIAAPEVEESRAEREEMAVGGSETILLAEDDEAVRTLTKRYLIEAGYTVIDAVDGVDAVKKFVECRETVDLLLLDLIMPKMNGKDALDEILKVSPGIKAIFFTGYSPEVVQQKAPLLNGFHLITKPVSPNVLLRKVRSVLDEADGTS